MPFEERNICFYLNEINEILVRNASALKEYLPPKLEEYMIAEVFHSGDLETRSIDQRAEIARLMDLPKDLPATIFLCQKGGFLGAKTIGFYIPDNVLIPMLAEKCIADNVMLPRQGTRFVIVDKMSIGLRIKLATDGLELQDDTSYSF